MSAEPPKHPVFVNNLVEPSCDVERPLAEQFGVSVTFAPETLAPPLDWDRLRKFVEETLPPEATNEVRHLVATFRSWFDACTALRRDRNVR